MAAAEVFIRLQAGQANLAITVTAAATLLPNIPAQDVERASFRALREARAFDTILDHSPLPDITSIGHTSTYFRRTVRNYLSRRVDGLFGEYVNDPTLFRNVMEDTSSVLSGSSVLEFILGANWGCGDLDMYAPRGEPCVALIRHLLDVEGYTVTKSFEGRNLAKIQYSGTQIKTVYKLAKNIAVDGQEPVVRSIDIIESAVAHPITPILRFHTSFVMNWISSDNIFVTYPRLTFNKKGLLNEQINMRRPRQAIWMEKYGARGFKVLKDTTELRDACGVACPTIWRSTEDVGCMVVPFGRGPVAGFDEVRWTLTRDGVTPKDRCDNPYCPRSQRLLARRDGNPPPALHPAIVRPADSPPSYLDLFDL